jgi:hypothetical protein
MLAYVFWHRHGAGSDAASYEAKLASFHAALGQRSWSERVQGAPWLQGDGYADWYLCDSWASLGELNRLAVGGTAADPHAAVAAMTAWGAGSVLELTQGAAGFQPVWRWLVKPAGLRYESFYAQVPAGLALWRRQMVLGPAPEFALAGEGAALQSLAVARTTHTWVCGAR